MAIQPARSKDFGRIGLLLGAVAGLLGMQTCDCDSLGKIFQSTNLWALLTFMLIGLLIGRLLGRVWQK